MVHKSAAFFIHPVLWPRYGRVMTTDGPNFPPGSFRKADSEDDAVFYAEPRFVTHIDDTAIAALTQFYRARLPAGGRVLDLMSSWVSHLPAEITFGEVVGHGMNREELAANERLDRFFVQNLNRETTLPLGDATLDAVAICVSIQYLQRPVEVLSECLRVLKPGGQIIVSFSNRCFPTKAVAIWQALDDEEHARLVGAYLQRAGFVDASAHLLVDGQASDPMIAVTGRKA
jgi:SAM-dependent methyltransferase